jgi:hypothetical protein
MLLNCHIHGIELYANIYKHYFRTFSDITICRVKTIIFKGPPGASTIGPEDKGRSLL